MKLPVEIVKCDYCGRLNILVDGYGKCRGNCPEMFTTIVEKHFVELPENIIIEIVNEEA